MKCRRNKEYINESGNSRITPIWFGSIGTDEFGHGKFEGLDNFRYINIINKKIDITNRRSGPGPYSLEKLLEKDENGFPVIERNFDKLYVTNNLGTEGYIYTKINNDIEGFMPIMDVIDPDTEEVVREGIEKYFQSKGYEYLIIRNYEEYANFLLPKFKAKNAEGNDYDVRTFFYSTKQEGVKDSLIQRLSVLKKELWYKASYGLPLLDKIRNKGILDATMIDIITSHPDVTNLVRFTSSFGSNHKYTFSFVITTVYTDKEISLDLSF